MTKATEIKLENKQIDGGRREGSRDHRRGMKLVATQFERTRARAFSIGVAPDLFSEPVPTDQPEIEPEDRTTEIRLRTDTLAIGTIAGGLLLGGLLGYIVGKRRR